jgi:tetratricopeptide (TPR) repeat protein
MNCQVKIRQHVNRGYIPSAKRFKEIDKLALDDSLPMKVKEIIAYTYDIAGEYQKLANYLDKIQALPDYLIELKSQAHRRLGEFAKALDLVKMLYQKGYCNMNYIKSALMNDHFFLGHYSEAFSLAKQLIENKHIQITQNDTVFSYLYHTYLNLQNHDQVIEICENYLKNSPPYDRACVNLLAAAYFNKMEFSKAKEQVQRMVDVDPEDKIALINLANICLLLEENELAAEYWTRALELEPTLLKDKDDLIAVLEKVGIWNKIASYAKSDRSAGVESMPRSSKVEMSSSSLASSESAYKPTNQAPAKAEQKRDAGLWVNKIGSPTIRRNFLTLAPVSSSPVTGSLEGSSSKTDLWDNLRDKQAIIDYTKQAIQKEGEKQVAILLKDSSKLGFVPSYQREVRKETKKLERKEEGKGQAPIPKPSDRDIYAIDGGKLYVKLDYRNVEEQVRNQGHGSSDDVMKDINTALETRRIARLEGQSGIKYLSATTVELKLTGRFSKDIRVLGEIREGSYQNKQGETVKYKYAILSSVKNHQEIARGVG